MDFIIQAAFKPDTCSSKIKPGGQNEGHSWSFEKNMCNGISKF